MNKQAEIISSILKELTKAVKPGIMTIELDGIARDLIAKAGAEPVNLGYKPSWARVPFPAALCTSVNNCICHGVPNEYKLRDGDIINLDMGIKYEGLCGDCAITVPVGEVEHKNLRLMHYALKALYTGIEMVKPGVDVIEIGQAIQSLVSGTNYVVNTRFAGHGIGEEMHQKPFIPHYYVTDPEWIKMFSWKLKVGDIICLEPMLTFKDPQGALNETDKWSVLTRDGRYSAMYEHMIEVTKDGYKILTDHVDENYAKY